MTLALSALDRWGFNVMFYLVAVLWQSSILFAAIMVIDFRLRHHKPGLRRMLWLIALLVAPALPLLSFLAEPAGLPQRAVVSFPVYTSALPLHAEYLDETAALEIRKIETTRQPNSLAYPWALAFVAYSTVSIIFFAWSLLGHVRIHQWLSCGRPVTDTRVLESFKLAAERLRLRRCARVKYTDRLRAPLTAGILRPTVLLPNDFANILTTDDLHAVALHEIAHIKQHDPLVLTSASLVRCVLFIHPLVWLAWRRLAILAEECADNAVLAVTEAPLDYARLLTTFAERLPRMTPATECAAGLVVSRSAFLRRIEAILGDRSCIRKLTRLAAAGTVAAVIVSLTGALALPLGSEIQTPNIPPELLAGPLTKPFTDTQPGASSETPGLKLLVTGGAQPLVGAQVLLARPGYSICFYDGKFTNDSMDNLEHGKRGKAPIATTDVDGRCELPEMDGPFVVAAVHPAGYGICSSEDLKARNDTLTLSSWAVLEGTVRLSDMPTPNANFLASETLILDRDGHPTKRPKKDNIEIGFICTGQTDSNSQFRVGFLPTGKILFSPNWSKNAKGESFAVNGLRTYVTVASGQTQYLDFGVKRWTVTGKFAPGKKITDWTKVKARLHLEAPHVGLPGDDEMWRVQGDFAKSPMGKLYFRDIAIKSDGSFTLDNVPEGRYQLIAFEPSGTSYASSNLKLPPDNNKPITSGPLTITVK